MDDSIDEEWECGKKRRKSNRAVKDSKMRIRAMVERTQRVWIKKFEIEIEIQSIKNYKILVQWSSM